MAETCMILFLAGCFWLAHHSETKKESAFDRFMESDFMAWVWGVLLFAVPIIVLVWRN